MTRDKAILGPRFAGALAKKWGREAKHRVAQRHRADQMGSRRKAMAARSHAAGAVASKAGAHATDATMPDLPPGLATQGVDDGQVQAGNAMPQPIALAPLPESNGDAGVVSARTKNSAHPRKRQESQSTLPKRPSRGVVLAPSTKAAKAAEAAATRKWAIGQGIIPSTVQVVATRALHLLFIMRVCLAQLNGARWTRSEVCCMSVCLKAPQSVVMPLVQQVTSLSRWLQRCPYHESYMHLTACALLNVARLGGSVVAGANSARSVQRCPVERPFVQAVDHPYDRHEPAACYSNGRGETRPSAHVEVV